MWIADGVCPEYAGIERWVRDSASFRREVYGGEGFVLAHPPEDVRRWVEDGVGTLMYRVFGQMMQVRYLFARLSTTDRDATLRIHTDAGMGSTHAWVLYCGEPDPRAGDEVGTAFFSHRRHGPSFAGTSEEHDRLVMEEAADLAHWTRTEVCPMRPNRALVYPASVFHARWPPAGWGSDRTDGRIVIVGFCDIALGQGEPMAVLKATSRKRSATVVQRTPGPRGGETHYRFPMPDKAHARNALARLSSAKGLSAADRKKITARANRILGKTRA